MSLPLLGAYGPCSPAGATWISVNMPNTGSFAIPNLGAATHTYIPEAPDSNAYTQGGGAVVWSNLGFTPTAFWSDARVLEAIGDPRSPRRYNKVTVTLQTSALIGPSPWVWLNPLLPDYNTTASRTIVWVWEYARHDSRVRKITASSPMFGGDGIFYTWELQADGTAVETDPQNLGGYFPMYDLLQTVAVTEERVDFVLANGGTASAQLNATESMIVTDFSSQLVYTGTATYGGDNYFTTVTIRKEDPDGYHTAPDSPHSECPLVFDAEIQLQGYDLSDLSKTYPFNKESDGTEELIRFKSGHCYYIYPFWKVVNGLTTTTMLWACHEPLYQLWAGETGNVEDDGIWHTGSPLQAGRHQYALKAAIYTETYPVGWQNLDIPWQINRDLVRVACVRRVPIRNPLTAPDGMRFGYGLLWPTPWQYEELWRATALSAFTDYLELGKATVSESTQSCLLLFSQGGSYSTALGSARTTWLSDNGEEPHLDESVRECKGHYLVGSSLLGQEILFPEGEPLFPPQFGVGILLRKDQYLYHITCANPYSLPSGLPSIVGNAGVWPGACLYDRTEWTSEEVGLSSDDYPPTDNP